MREHTMRSLVSEEELRSMTHGDILSIFHNETLMIKCSKFLDGWQFSKWEKHNVRVGFFKWEYKWVLVSDLSIPEK